MTTENQRLHSTIKNMDKDISDLKNEIKSRDDTISEKEKVITEQKRSGIEQEKNRFVLEHKIEDLKNQILPKDELIMDLRSQIDAMEDELNAVTKTQAELQLNVDEAKSKLQGTTAELNLERKKASKMSMVQSRLYKEFSELTLILQACTNHVPFKCPL